MPFLPVLSARTLQVLGDRVSIRLATVDSPYSLSIVTVEVPPGGFIPPSSHAVEEEFYLVLEGRLQVTLGDVERCLGPGDAAHVPPGTPHAYHNAGELPARFVAVAAGGTLDRFFVEVSERVQQLPRDGQALQHLMQRYGITPADAPRRARPASASSPASASHPVAGDGTA